MISLPFFTLLTTILRFGICGLVTWINQLVVRAPDNNITDTEAWLGKNSVPLGECHGEIIFFMN